MKSNNPYFTSWFNPKQTVIDVLDVNSKYSIYLPLIIASLSTVIEYLDKVGEFGVLTIMISGIIMFIVLTYISPWVLIKVGKIWGGKSSFHQMQKVISITQIPTIFLFIYQLIFLSLGKVVSYENVNFLLQFVVWFVSIRIFITGVAKAQNFSYGFAILNAVIPILPLLIIKLMLLH